MRAIINDGNASDNTMQLSLRSSIQWVKWIIFWKTQQGSVYTYVYLCHKAKCYTMSCDLLDMESSTKFIVSVPNRNIAPPYKGDSKSWMAQFTFKQQVWLTVKRLG